MSNLNYWERLQFLQLYSLKRRREQYFVIYTWKTSVGLVPNNCNLISTETRRHRRKCIGKHSYSMQVDNRCTTDDKVRILFGKKVKRSILLKVMPQRITQEHEKSHEQKKYKETKTKHQGKE